MYVFIFFLMTSFKWNHMDGVIVECSYLECGRFVGLMRW